MVATRWSLEGLVNHFQFVHQNMLDHRFVWMLGAGASVGSGIPLGSQLVDQWLEDLFVKSGRKDESLSTWSEANLGLQNFSYSNRAAFYSQIYSLRFHRYPDEGYAFLEDVMSGKEPSLGYSILAKTLAAKPPRHNAVITTNFDNLVADALAIYTDTIPFVCGHESLTDFVRLNMRRPVICKIHRDLLLAPQNTPRDLRRLSDSWGRALCELFREYTPFFVGYGGNDDTLMDLLESLNPGEIKGQMIWCYHENSIVPDRIDRMVESHHGVCVPIPDFDLLMVLLGDKMEMPLLDQEITERARDRARRYRKRIRELQYGNHPDVQIALDSIIQRTGSWWDWHRLAGAEPDEEKRHQLYQTGLEKFPGSPDLQRSYATSLKLSGKYEDAKAAYEKAISLDPNDATTIGDFAALHAYHLKGIEQAEEMYRRATELGTVEAHTLADFAIFLATFKDDLTETETFFRRAIDQNPTDADNVLNFAEFLMNGGRIAEAGIQLETASRLVLHDEIAMLVALYRGALFSAEGMSDAECLKVLSNALQEGAECPPWDFKNIKAFVKSRQKTEDSKRYLKYIDLLSKGPTEPGRKKLIFALEPKAGSVSRTR